MSTKDEEKWLRMVLEGRVKPEDAEWRKIWRERDFAEVRRVLLEVGMMGREEVEFDKEKMWRVLESYRRKGGERRRIAGAWRWVAVFLLPLLLGGTIWIVLGDKQERPVVAEAVLEAGRSQAVLILAKGERIDLTSGRTDSLPGQVGVHVLRDSARSVVYERHEEQAGNPEYNTLVVPRQGEFQVVLADGSKVYLNSESEIRYPTFFAGGERRVYLKGEAFFEVTSDTSRPFIVNVGEMDVRVLGTRFNVNAYVPERAIRTTLVSGKVRVSDREDKAAVVLEPGQQAVWKKNGLTMREVDALAVSAWVDGKFYFEEGMTLEEITEQLQRWYDIDFFFASERVKHFVFAGMIKKEYAANEIFSIIEKAARVKFTVNGRTVAVSELKR